MVPAVSGLAVGGVPVSKSFCRTAGRTSALSGTEDFFTAINTTVKSIYLKPAFVLTSKQALFEQSSR